MENIKKTRNYKMQRLKSKDTIRYEITCEMISCALI